MAEDQNEQATIQDGAKVTFSYVLKVDGEIYDQSEEGKPLQFIQGNGQMIRGFESQISGMKAGESKDFVVQPVDAYGEIDLKAFVDTPIYQFPKKFKLEIGKTIQLRDPEGVTVSAVIEDIQEDYVRLNLNHPLAGKELYFSVAILNVLPPAV